MRIVFTLIAAAIGYWLGWYYGAILGYHLVPNSEWFGAVIAYLLARTTLRVSCRPHRLESHAK
jgi:hypothetical protein